MIPDKFTLAAGQPEVTVVPVRTFAAVKRKLTEIDFTKNQWIDDPAKQTLKATTFNRFVMGGDSGHPYNPNWLEQDARTALLAVLKISTTGIVAVGS